MVASGIATLIGSNSVKSHALQFHPSAGLQMSLA